MATLITGATDKGVVQQPIGGLGAIFPVSGRSPDNKTPASNPEFGSIGSNTDIDYLLLEDGSFILLEGFGKLTKENSIEGDIDG